ncbi:nitroreductase family protein [Neisseria subflava]|uniref:nitroreductase family protein n=1 Tax=Neisseria subflava TaxID=28449 RepID=UPI002029E6D1|nr:nitroreductase family protein [Neisseria subflava]
MMNVQDIVQKRYSTKSFDASKKISAEDFAQIEAALRYSPSSVNIQPWHFVITDNEAGKARVAKSAENFPYNLPKIINASHVIVFAARVHADEDYLAGVLEQEDKDGRFATAENKQMGDNARRTFLGIHRNQMQDKTQWLSRQVHINLGFTLFAAAALGWMPFRWKGWIWLFWIKNLVWLKEVIVLLPLLHWAIAPKMILMLNCRNHVWKTR